MQIVVASKTEMQVEGEYEKAQEEKERGCLEEMNETGAAKRTEEGFQTFLKGWTLLQNGNRSSRKVRTLRKQREEKWKRYERDWVEEGAEEDN